MCSAKNEFTTKTTKIEGSIRPCNADTCYKIAPLRVSWYGWVQHKLKLCGTTRLWIMNCSNKKIIHFILFVDCSLNQGNWLCTQSHAELWPMPRIRFKYTDEIEIQQYTQAISIRNKMKSIVDSKHICMDCERVCSSNRPTDRPYYTRSGKQNNTTSATLLAANVGQRRKRKNARLCWCTCYEMSK